MHMETEVYYKVSEVYQTINEEKMQKCKSNASMDDGVKYPCSCVGMRQVS